MRLPFELGCIALASFFTNYGKVAFEILGSHLPFAVSFLLPAIRRQCLFIATSRDCLKCVKLGASNTKAMLSSTHLAITPTDKCLLKVYPMINFFPQSVFCRKPQPRKAIFTSNATQTCVTMQTFRSIVYPCVIQVVCVVYCVKRNYCTIGTSCKHQIC